MKYKGSTFLMVMGILCIIFGVAGIGTSMTATAALSVLSAYGVSGSIYTIGTAISVIGAVVMLVSGILGVVNHKKPAKAGVNVILGVLMIVVQVISIIISFAMMHSINQIAASMGVSLNLGSTGAMSFVGLIIPILYLIAAFQLKSNPVNPYGDPNQFSDPFGQR